MDSKKTFYAKNSDEWRSWLEKNHNKEESVWLQIFKKKSKTPSISLDEAIDDALYFGWIDSRINKNDDKSYHILFSKRKPKSKWSKSNIERVTRLIKEGRMTQTGFESIETAKQNGSWIV